MKLGLGLTLHYIIVIFWDEICNFFRVGVGIGIKFLLYFFGIWARAEIVVYELCVGVVLLIMNRFFNWLLSLI